MHQKGLTMGETFPQKLAAFTQEDWNDKEVHEKSQKLLRKVKWLREADLDKNGDIEFYELQKCVDIICKHWSVYPSDFMALNNGDNTFGYVHSFCDDIFRGRTVVGTVMASSIYDVFGKSVLLLFACIKSGSVMTRKEKEAERDEKRLKEKERLAAEKARKLSEMRRKQRGRGNGQVQV